MNKEIGGYFELETIKGESYFKDCIALNSGRSSLRYIIRANNIKTLHTPYYTCWSVTDTIKEEGVEIRFYNIDENFLPTKEFKEDDFILYTNYFGVNGKNIKELSQKYKNLIIDNAQSFFFPLEIGLSSFNSVRKFFGVPDGSYLKCNKILNKDFEQDISYKRSLFLLKRHDLGANAAYNDFQLSEATFELNKNIKLMSNLTCNLLKGIDYDFIKQRRLQNFKIYDEILKSSNELKIKLDCDDIPMVYPYLIKKEGLREKLIQNKIYIAKYWAPLEDNLFESNFQKFLLPLPLDQRYNEEDIKRVIGHILNQ